MAILGTLATNIWIFTNPAGPAAFLGESTSLGETLLRTASNGKFLALLSLMFGIGLSLQHRSATRSATRNRTPWPGRYLWRSTLLLLEGTLHYVLIFEFDVLMYYALISIPVAFIVNHTTRTVKTWLTITATLHIAVITFLTALMVTQKDPLTGSRLPTDTSSWPTQVHTRLTHPETFRAEALFVLPSSTALFLAGALLLKAGALENTARGRTVQRNLVLIGLGIGIPLNLLTALSGPSWFLADRYLAAPLVAFGLLGAITRTVHRITTPGLVQNGLTAIGRTALSCYILQNLLASTLCYTWGLGLATTFEPHRVEFTVTLWLTLATTLATLATQWLKRNPKGPLETLWDKAYTLPFRSRATP
ncbi:DUF418 domain-containing protein [Actinosynnema sp. NPDC020468]|uniref:DUF418 domain-containing protein n=1 Tax=Actinosynnema sp. NPDC020468 TaxID=3154488 RepID=UPI0033C0E769